MKADAVKALYKDCLGKVTEQTKEIHKLVLGYGHYDADIMIIGESPSADEEILRTAFAGKSGKMLMKFIQELNLTNEDVYITNILKYRPYKINESTNRVVNRSPKKEEIKFFLPYLYKEIDIIAPKIIITLGSNPLKTLMENEDLTIGDEHGKVKMKYINDKEYRIFPIYHPSTFGTVGKDALNEDIEVLKKLMQHIKKGLAKTVTETMAEHPKINLKKVNMATMKTKSEKKASGVKTIIVYGGSGYADDPTLVAVDRVSRVFTELGAHITRLDLFKDHYNMNDFINELKTANSVVIATTVEWFGIGGKLQSFLDKCWQYGDKDDFEDVYMLGIVLSLQGFERDGYNHLIKSWELLGGVEGVSICGSINSSAKLETNKELLIAIEKKAEEFYRMTHQKRVTIPTSIRNNKVFIEVPVQADEATHPNRLEENEKVLADEVKDNHTLIPNYNEYIEKQEQDIEDISNLLKQKLTTKSKEMLKTEPELLKERYKGAEEQILIKIQWNIEDKRSRNLVMDIQGRRINTYFGNIEDANIILNSEYETLQKFVHRKMTIQRAFMIGELKAKGDFSIIYKMDDFFSE